MSKDKESICVTVRVRPLSSKQSQEDSRVCLKVDEPANLISLSGEKQAKDFYFDSVCDRISQNEFFERVGRRSTDYCMEGYNCTIFAYGQTGAGKTFTMMGVNPESRDYHDLRGLIPRTLEYLFQSIEKQINELGVEYMIKCSFIQIYNEQIIDLRGNSSTLSIREDMKKGVYIEGVTEQMISRSDEALQILRKGSKGRHVGSTCYNQNSSRSHSVFTMQIDSQKMNNGIKSTKSRHFHFIDLAGSEKTKKINGDRLKQGCSINKSLHVLSTVIGSLGEVSEGKTRHINYRDSKLTFLLKDSLGGNSKTHVIANISPSWVSASETRSTLIFARKVKMIKMNKVSINEDSSGNLESLKAEIKRLKSQNIFLRNGNVGPINNSLAVAGNMPGNNANSKMMGVLQQYVDEQLDKQTQMQLQLAKIKNKNSYLQKGIKHFSENQKQMRMIIAIYQDKIKRLKEVEQKLLQEVEELNSGQKIEMLKEYFEAERNNLLDEIERLKKVGSSTALVKTLLRDLKIVREQNNDKEDDEAMIKILCRNNQFLQQIKQSIKELEPQAQEGKATAAVLKENQDIKNQNEELSEKIEKRNIEIIQIKDKLEQAETLLEQSIATQISLEKKLSMEIEERERIEENMEIEKEKSEKTLMEAKEEIRCLISKQNELDMVISENNIQLSQMKKNLSVLKDKQHFEQINFKEQIEGLSQEKFRLEEVVREKIHEIQKIKNESIEFKSQIQKIEGDLKMEVEDYQKKIAEYEEKYKNIENQKAELKTKFDTYKEKYEAKNVQKDNQIISLNDKILQLKEQLRQINHQITKEHKNTNLWKEKSEAQIKQFQAQKVKWEEHNREMLAMINEKQTSDSETHKKLTQSQLQLMEANEKVSDLRNQILKAEQSLITKQKQLQDKINEYQIQIKEKEEAEKKYQNQIAEGKKKLRQIEEQLNADRRKIEKLEEQLSDKEISQSKTQEQLQKLKQKEKQLRIAINDLKNQNYAIKKNHQVEVQSFRETLKRKDDQLAGQERQHVKIKESLQKALGETKQIMENEIQVLKQNEQSIKKALEAHLKNKQTKIVQLKQFLEDNEQKLTAKQEKLRNLENEHEQIIKKLGQLEEEKILMIKNSNQFQEKVKKLEEELTESENQHIRVLEDNENNFNEQLDAKNAQIQKLQKQVESMEEQIDRLNQIALKNLNIRAEIEEVYSKMEIVNSDKQLLENELQESKRLYQQSDHQCGHLEAKLVERDERIRELELQISTNNMSVENSQNALYQQLEGLKALLKSKQQFEGKLKLQIEEKIAQSDQKTGKIEQMSQNIQNLTKTIDLMEKDLRNLKNIRQQLQNSKVQIEQQLIIAKQKQQTLLMEISQIAQSQTINGQSNEQPSNSPKSAFEKFKFQMTSLNKQIDQWSRQNTELKQAQQMSLQDVEKLQRIISDQNNTNATLTENYTHLSEQNGKLMENLSELTEKVAESTKKICALEQSLSGLKSQIRQKDEEVEELRNNMMAMEESKFQQIANLNNLYEKLKEQKQILQKNNESEYQMVQNAKIGLQSKIQELQKSIDHQHQINRRNQTHLVVEKERNEELQKYIEEQNDRLIQISKERQGMKKALQQSHLKLEENVQQGQKYRLNMEHQVRALKEELSAITQQATEWKNKMEQLERDLKMSNERSEKYRKQFYRQKDSNKEFKQLLDNAHCQIDSFKAQAQDKDRLYHQLLDKVSRNDVERKGLLTQDRKISELLQKSRIEVNEYRKKYDDQLKINNLLKQEIEKKELDNVIIKQKSEDYVKKNQNLIDSIRADYTLLEENHKKKQMQCNELKKTLQTSSQRISQLEEHYQQVLEECRNAQRQNEQIKKQYLKNGSDEKQLMFINKVKEENKMLRKQLQKTEEELTKEKSEMIKIKSEKRYGKESIGEVSIAEYNKKLMEIKYLQKQIDDLSMLFGNIQYTNKKSVGEGIRTGITQLQRQLAKTKNENMELKEELHSKCQKLNILQSHKYRTYKDDDDTFTRLRSKISKTASTYEGMRHSKEEDKSILQAKDSNKSHNHWAYNR